MLIISISILDTLTLSTVLQVFPPYFHFFFPLSLSLSLSLSYLLSHFPTPFSLCLRLRDEVKIVLVSITFVGFIVYDLVYFMAITNYVVQSEMIFYLIRSVKKLVKRRQYPSMDATIKAGLVQKHVHFHDSLSNSFIHHCPTILPSCLLCHSASLTFLGHLFRIFVTSEKNCID